jgi:hypothetical protein
LCAKAAKDWRRRNQLLNDQAVLVARDPGPTVRKVQNTRIAAIAKEARTEIARFSNEMQVDLSAHGLSEYAPQLLGTLPKIDLPVDNVDIQPQCQL